MTGTEWGLLGQRTGKDACGEIPWSLIYSLQVDLLSSGSWQSGAILEVDEQTNVLSAESRSRVSRLVVPALTSQPEFIARYERCKTAEENIPEGHEATQDPKEQRGTNTVNRVHDTRRRRVYPCTNHTVDNQERR